MTEFTHDVHFRASYDKREQPGGGACGMTMEIILKGPLGAISFQIYTDWTSRPLLQTFNWNAPKPWNRGIAPGTDYGSSNLMSGGVYLHCATQINPDWPGPHKCDILGGNCWGDMGYSIGDKVLDAMVTEGDVGLWREMEAIYTEWFAGYET
jgi:hypothetical protein